MKYLLVWTILLLLLVQACIAYHDADNVRFDCWPLDANEFNPATIDCGGLSLEWPEEPPDRVELFQKFNVTYRAVASSEFYTMHLAYPGYNESSVRDLCLNTTCPTEASDVSEDTCCVWHANIHTCHPSVMNSSSSCNRLCGPWVANGNLATHTASEWGPITQTFVAVDVQVDFLGLNFIIAHLRVGNMQIALGKPIEVIAPRVCGDGICTAEAGESCSTCPTDCCSGAIAGGVLSVLIVTILIVILTTVFVWYYFQRRKVFFDESWIINYEDIKKDTEGQRVGGSVVSLSMKSARRVSMEAESYSGSSGNDHANSYTINALRKRQLFIETGSFEGRTVAIKRVQRRDFVFNNTVRKEVMQIRMLDHPNLCKFIGATVKDPIKLVFVMEYCPKGSLNDVLQNEDIPLNWGFRFSFATDIARGMAYLHHKKFYHNHLTSSNCVIDDRWTIKITDFGLPSFRSSESRRLSKASRSSNGISPTSDVMGTRYTAAKIYLPPEVRQEALPCQPQPTTDIYSFAILLVEVATRLDPYSEEVDLDSNGKPRVDKSCLITGFSPCPCPDDYFDLISKCWSFQPHNRPTFEQVKKTLLRINPNRESPVDMMMIMMEKYSKHLEALVTERTQELIAEQNKTANLLHSMLPRPVADDLKQGKAAPAKSFKSATIFFSDIVGFTSLASTSTPMQIVNLLNELYSMFDNILDLFDVYKVETIGDSYMVVSGVPKENGDRHAGEIASMAIELIAACSKFKIPHRPNVKLEIRTGIHSGHVCAGVIGQKMPRYCLFGDTVNTASRMETTSEAMKIQCSDSTCELLKKLGGFQLTCRGSINVKGKGTMQTWWIEGKDHQVASTTTNIYNTMQVKPPPRRAISETVYNKFSGRQTDSPSQYLPSRESSQDSGVNVSRSVTVALPGSISYEDF